MIQSDAARLCGSRMRKPVSAKGPPSRYSPRLEEELNPIIDSYGPDLPIITHGELAHKVSVRAYRTRRTIVMQSNSA